MAESTFLLIPLVSLGAGFATFLLLQFLGRTGWRFPVPTIDRRTADIIFCLMACAYFVTFSALSILRHLSFNSDGYDLSIFDQVVWNSLHGHLFETSILPDITLLLSQRFSPILLALVPLYALWSSPIVLMVVQTLGIAVAAFPIYWFARSRVGHALALTVAGAYFLSPALQGVNLFEFHEIALAIPLFSFATFFLLRRTYAPMLVCLGLTLLVKEDMAFVVIAFGLYLLLIQRKTRLGLGVSLFAMVWAVLLLQYVIPYFNGAPLGTGNYYYFGAGIAAGRGRYDYLGRTLYQVIETVITQPGLVLQHLFVPLKFDYVAALLIPLALLPLLGAEVAMLALPTLGISLLSDYAPQFSIDYHYSASLLPFLFFAMALGMQRILDWSKRIRSPGSARRLALAAFALTAAGLGYYFLAPGPLAQRFEPGLYATSAHTAIGHTLASRIPDDAVVVTQSSLMPQLSERRGIYGFPTIFDYCETGYVLADTTQISYRLRQQMWTDWFATRFFDTLAQPDGYILAKRKTPDQTVQIHFGDQMTLVAYTLPLTETVQGGQHLCPVVDWRADRNISKGYVVQAHLVDPQGHSNALDAHEPRQGFAPTNGWKVGQLVEDSFSLAMSPALAASAYAVTVSVYDPTTGTYLNAHDAADRDLGLEPVVTTVAVEKNKASITATDLRLQSPLIVDMQEIRLLGFETPVKETAVDTTLPVGFYWRARGLPRGDYAVAVQLRGPDGRVMLEQSSRPANNTYPTTQWALGEVLLDWHDLVVPADFPAGEYAMAVVLRDAVSQAPLGEAQVTTVRIKEK